VVDCQEQLVDVGGWGTRDGAAIGGSIADLPLLTTLLWTSIFLAVYHRGELSLGDHRKRLGFSAYHWAILVLDANHERYYAYDVTDGSTPDPVMRREIRRESHDSG
jgi:hypothetical protein